MAPMDEALDLDQVRRRVEALGALGAPVEALRERLAQAAPDGGPVLIDELEAVIEVVDRATDAVRRALASAPDTPEVAAATAVAAAPVADAALAAMVTQQVDRALAAAYGSWREDILARTVAEVSTRTARGIADLLQSRAFLDRVLPQVLAKADEAARRAVGELSQQLRGQTRGGTAPGATAEALVAEVLKRLNDSGVLDGHAPAAVPPAADVLDSEQFKAVLEDRLHHIVTYIKSEVVPSEIRRALQEAP